MTDALVNRTLAQRIYRCNLLKKRNEGKGIKKPTHYYSPSVFNSCIIHLSRGAHEKVVQATIHLWWHVYFYLHFLSRYLTIILFATTHIVKVCYTCIFTYAS